MKKFNFLITYDIANKKRLRQISKTLENVALRIQNSIFFYEKASQDEIVKLVEIFKDIVEEEEDDIRIYKIDVSRSLHLQSGIDLKYPKIL